MKKQGLLLMVRGIGIGLILAGSLFFAIKSQLMHTLAPEITDNEITTRAKSLGMIPITQLDNVYLTDDEVIAKAKELGMEFKD